MNRLKYLLLFFCALAGLNMKQGNAQCCSPGNPVSGSGNVGIVDQHSLRNITFYRQNLSDTYYSEDKISDAEFQGTKAMYRYIGEILSYGLLKRLTLEVELGYFINKVKEDKFQTIRDSGISTAVAGVKYCFLKSISHWEITGGLSAKIPFSQKSTSNIFGPIPADIQASTGAFGIVGQVFVAKAIPDRGLKFIVLNRYEHNYRNLIKYHFGDVLFTSVFVSKGFPKHPFFKHINIMAQIRNEYRTADKDLNLKESEIGNTGGDITFSGLQFTYTFKPDWAVSLGADAPVYRKYNDRQLSPKYALSLTITKTFRLKK
jgi:hypothetical protein